MAVLKACGRECGESGTDASEIVFRYIVSMNLRDVRAHLDSARIGTTHHTRGNPSSTRYWLCSSASWCAFLSISVNS